MHIWVKICGVTSVEQALAIADLGVDAIGINLWPNSKRSVSYEHARMICDALASHAPSVERVALFVNVSEDPQTLSNLAVRCNASTIQLHGAEPPALTRALCALGWPVIRALRIASEDTPKAIRAALDEVCAAHPTRARALLDARVPGTWGGTGHQLDHALVRSLAHTHTFLLAGGLKPENIAACRPLFEKTHGVVGVDTASGVEQSPGHKDLERVRLFVHRARALV